MNSIAVYAPQLDSYDYVEVERGLSAFLGYDSYSVASGFGLQGMLALYLFMRNPHAEIRVSFPPDSTLINPWWYDVPSIERVKLIPVRGNSQLAVANSVLRGHEELLAFCEFDEHLLESAKSTETTVPWRLVEKARRHGMLVTTRILRSKEEASG